VADGTGASIDNPNASPIPIFERSLAVKGKAIKDLTHTPPHDPHKKLIDNYEGVWDILE
jgi:hypothetical protein